MHPVPRDRVQGRILEKLPGEMLVDPVEVWVSELSNERARCVKCSKRSVYPWESGGARAALVGSKAEAGAQAMVWGGEEPRPRNHFESQGI